MRKVLLFMLLFVLSINAQNGLSAQNGDKIAVIGNVISFEHLTEPDKIPTTGSTSGTFNISYSVRVNLNVKAVAYGEYSGKTITFECKSVLTDDKFLKYGNVLCFLEKRENGVYVMPYPLDCCYDVYYDNNEGWVAAAFSGERFLPYTYQSNKRLLSLNSEQYIDSAYIKTRIERCYLDTQVKTIEEAYLFNDGKAIPKYGYPVSCLVDYILTTIKNKTNAVDNSAVATPRMVDLGLSVKWADCNLGATRPEEFGRYYAWGETEQKTTYTPENYKWCNMQSNILTKYVVKEIDVPVYKERKDANGLIIAEISLYDPLIPPYGTIDGKTELEPSDDAATAYLGNGWRTPTKAEIQELYDNCEWTLIEQNGVRGYKATSKINGKSIFLPFAGWWSFYGLKGIDKNKELGVCYMSATLSEYHIDAVHVLRLKDSESIQDGVSTTTNTSRCDGAPIRPVYDPK